MHELPHTHSCFVCGEANRLGLQLRFHTDGETVRTRFTPRPEHIGFKNVVHGGLIATVLDEIMVWACAVKTRQFGYCAEMTVRFRRPLHPGDDAVATASLVSDRRGRILEAKSELTASDGTVLATATGKYFPVKPSELTEFMTELVGDRRWVEPEAL